MNTPEQRESGLYILLLSLHGLIRGDDLELGRDADTGGQVKYVVELARALADHPDVEQVDLLTRLVSDPRVDSSYAEPVEQLGEGARIVRIPCGPSRYLPKESLWTYLDSFVDHAVHFLRSQGRAPDLVHGHYADAGYAAARLSGIIGVPMAFTGHSLGRVKRQRLLDQGLKPEQVEKRYKITRRIEAEETALDHAAFVVASTNQEVQEQYELYDHYQPRRMMVIPPGVDLSRFKRPSRSWQRPQIQKRIHAFLHDRRKPMILAISRPDPRKNLATLVRAFGENPRLREVANLVIVAGCRERISEMDGGAQEVLTELLLLIDEYDLYGSIAYPKQHDADDVPLLYQMATRSRGVFVNPALTEPFGLTLLEAAACGLPVVATQDGGPQDILSKCRNGLLIDPLDSAAMSAALLEAVSDPKRWRSWSKYGVSGSQRHFSWSAHVKRYLRTTQAAITKDSRNRRVSPGRSRLITADRILISDIDNTLIGDRAALKQLLEMLAQAGDSVAFGVATGRSMELTLKVLRQWKIPMPQLLITSVGSSIHYGPRLVEDKGWEKHINYRWRPEPLREAMDRLPGLTLQPPEGQGKFKISYDIDPKTMLPLDEMIQFLRRTNLQARLIYSHQAYLDVLPIRASKGSALRYFALRWDIAPESCLVAGDSGNDEEMLTGNTLAVVVGNHDPELEHLREDPSVYFASTNHAWGIIEGIRKYEFLSPDRPVPTGEHRS